MLRAFPRVRPGVRAFTGYNKVEPGIEVVLAAIESGRLFIDAKACPWLVREMGNYSWGRPCHVPWGTRADEGR